MNTASVDARTASLFDNYTRRKSRVAPAVWAGLRVLVLALALGEIVLLFTAPQLGLALFWTVAVPCLPAVFAIAPGLWRQVCPMAFVNQWPRLGGFGLALTLPAGLRYWSYLGSVGLLVVMVALRVPLLNATGWATGGMCLAALALALAGGLAYKGRSGWCGTFCPLAPVQRAHGQSPLAVVPNGYCPTCVGCQKNCFDFNPRAAIFGDLDDADARHAHQRMLFMAGLPGLIVGYYTTGALAARSLPLYWAALVVAMLASAGLFFALRALFKATSYRTITVFSVLALLAYYFFSGPVLVRGVSSLLDLAPAPWLVEASRAIAVPIVIGLWRMSERAETAYRALAGGAIEVRVDDSRLHRRADGGEVEVTERQSGKTFSASPDATLLEAMEAAGVPIDFGCRSGLCGADPVGIVEGHEHLGEPGEDELTTLRRLGLDGRARLACCARACGPVTIDRDPRSVPARADAAPAAPAIDHARAAGVARVVIVGNGVAGITAAEALRRDSPSVDIDVIADEPYHFYNRMALGRLIYNRGSMDGMHLVPETWYAQQRVTVWLNTVARSIDRERHELVLGTGERLPYDRLVLATGARAGPPGPGVEGCANSFLLRTAADAQGIRATAQRLGARHAVVIGGGVLGIEAAEALRHLGLRVTVVHRGERLMDRQLDATGASRLAGYLANVGIDVLTDARIAAFEVQDLMRSVRLEDGRVLAADLFVACAGIQPNVALARDAGLEVGRGVRVDERMCSSDPLVYAVGDVAEPRQAGPLGLWPVAVAQARIAAAALCGLPAKASAPHIVLQLKSDGIDLRSFGDPGTVPPGAEVLTAEPEATAWYRLVVQDDRLLSAVFVGPPGSAKALEPLLKAGADLAAQLPAWRPRVPAPAAG